MITLYTFGTPNGWRASIMLEELGLPYQAEILNLREGAHMNAAFAAINPIQKIPAMVEDGHSVFGSGAILLHLAMSHSRLLPTDPAERADCLSWLMVGVSDLAPAGVFKYWFGTLAPEPNPAAVDKMQQEAKRCQDAIEARLGNAQYLAGSDYSIADIAAYPFVAVAAMFAPDFMAAHPNIARWAARIAARPAVQRGMAVPPPAFAKP